MTETEVIAALGKVIHPEKQKDIISLNMLKHLMVSGNEILFTVELDSQSRQTKIAIEDSCRAEIKKLNAEANIDIRFSGEAVTTARRNDNVLKGVKNIIAVVSGKGGVGKSTVSSNLALALAETGASVGLMDADIYGPSAPIMFGVRGERPMMREVDGKGMIVPLEKFGIKIISIGLLVDEKSAVAWRGPMVSSAIRQFVTDVDWGELDYLVIDMPPGTGDIHLTLMQLVPVTGAVVVTTPQDVALADAKKAVAMFGQAQVKIPIIGLVENMAYFTPAELPENKYYIFGKQGGQRLADEFDLDFLGEIPIVQSIREGGDIGVPAMLNDDFATKSAFVKFADEVVKNVNRINKGEDKTVVI